MSDAKSSRSAPIKKTNLGTPTLLFIDVISFFFSLMPGVIAFSMMGLFVYYGFAHTVWVLFLAPWVLFFSFILIVFCIRICLPTLKKGRYKRELNKPMVAWFCHFALSRAAKIIGLTPLLQSFNCLKFFYWRALGIRVSFEVMNSYDIDFVDCPLITIGRGVTLASQVSISCHSDVGNYLVLSPVVIEDNVFIGMATLIGPGTTIKSGAWIGYGNTFVNQVVGRNEKVGNTRPIPE